MTYSIICFIVNKHKLFRFSKGKIKEKQEEEAEDKEEENSCLK